MYLTFLAKILNLKEFTSFIGFNSSKIFNKDSTEVIKNILTFLSNFDILMSKNVKMKLHINIMILEIQNLFNYNPKNFDILKCQNDKKPSHQK